MKPIGLVFLYNRNQGAPEEISRKFFGDNLSMVTENLVQQGLVNLVDLKRILDSRAIYWAGIKENFNKIIVDNETIGKLAWKVFKDQSGKEGSEEIKSLVYEGTKTPWKFTLMVCVIYE
jgi:hypothetical protein